MLLTGLMVCKDEYELDTILKRLKEVRQAKVYVNDCTIAVDYVPSDTETAFEEEEAIARLLDIIESVQIHGFSMS